MLDQSLKDFIQSLSPISIENWNHFESLLERKEIKKNDHFFHHTDNCEDVALVSKGLFRIYLTDSSGEERTFSFIPENSFILDFFLSDSSKNLNLQSQISVQALEDAEIFTIKHSSFLALIQESLTFNNIYREILLRNYMKKTKREIEFVQFNAKERLQRFLLNKRIHIDRIPKAFLASYLGIQPPSLSRLLREIKP